MPRTLCSQELQCVSSLRLPLLREWSPFFEAVGNFTMHRRRSHAACCSHCKIKDRTTCAARASSVLAKLRASRASQPSIVSRRKLVWPRCATIQGQLCPICEDASAPRRDCDSCRASHTVHMLTQMQTRNGHQRAPARSMLKHRGTAWRHSSVCSLRTHREKLSKSQLTAKQWIAAE